MNTKKKKTQKEQKLIILVLIIIGLKIYFKMKAIIIIFLGLF
jgi:hypothetical protein